MVSFGIYIRETNPPVRVNIINLSARNGRFSQQFQDRDYPKEVIGIARDKSDASNRHPLLFTEIN